MTGLMAALHEARTLINEGVIGPQPKQTDCEDGDACTCAYVNVDDPECNPFVALIMARHRTVPKQIAELYTVAGMIGPGKSPALLQPGYHQPHAKAVTQRIMTLLRDGPQSAQELCNQLGASRGTVQTSINRLRERGAHIEGVSLGGRQGCRYTLRAS